MSLSQFKDNECLLTTQKHCPCIEFVLGDHDRHGFHGSQLLHYRLEANNHGSDAPPEKLVIALATADVTVTGWRLERIADLIRDGELLALRAQPLRYAQLDSNRPGVAAITVTHLSNVETRPQ